MRYGYVKIMLATWASLLLLGCDHADNHFQNGNQSQKNNLNQSVDVKKSSEDFLAENRKQPGIHVTDSGLQYRINREGTGRHPKATDAVTVLYEGRLIDGTVFDATQPNHPVTFPLNQVIPGWTEGVQLMKEGAEYTFYIPPQLAYGNQAVGHLIPRNSALVFDITLVKVGQ